MEFGIQFFPDVGPQQRSAADYFSDCLKLVELCDQYGYTNVRTVEHYFHPYGGYSPNPIVFLSAASQRSKKARMVTGAVLPVFNNPLKLAGEIGMLDAISGGRLDVGFARAFLPHEYKRFGVSMDESLARFEEGIEQVRKLLAEENVSSEGRFHSFKNVTSLPRPTQKPTPPLWTAAFATIESFERAGKNGHFIMGIPLGGSRMKEMMQTYRKAWKAAGHPGNGKIMLAFHMYCADTDAEAVRIAREPLQRYLKSLVDAASDFMSGTESKDYKGYDKMIAQLDKETPEGMMEAGSAWIGSPERLKKLIAEYDESTGGFESASLQVNFNTIGYEDAARSMKVFGEKVIPHFMGKRAQAAE